MPSFQQFFPKMSLQKTTPHNTDLIDSKWYHRRILLAITRPTLQNLYRAWYHFTQFTVLKRKHRLFIKLLKRQHLQDLIHEVDQASQQNDSFKVYNIISRYTPKQPRKKIRLRSDTGAPASAEEVRHMTQEFIRTKWAGPTKIYLEPRPFQGIPFDVDELAHEIAKTPAVKSVAPQFLPGIVLKPFAHSLAQMLYTQLAVWWTQDQIFVPAQWRHAWVAFLPKPNKVPSCLDNLRAIALMEPLGKNVLGIITRQLRRAIHATIVRWPQFAYVEFRSAHDAIRRVSAHCLETRQLLRNQQRNVHQRAAQLPTFRTCGGIQLFLDIHRAFDAIPRQPLFDHLRSMPINQDLVSILGSWHNETAYITQHDQISVETATGCGIRQGCRAAPVLWTAFTDLIFEALSQEIASTWIQKAVTLFADDIHCGDVFYSEWELEQILCKFGILLDVIERHGLTISLSKSMVLISIGGTNCRKVQARLLHRDDHGCFLFIPRADGRQSKLPVQKTACYLGVQMSYNMPEMLTLQHRMKAARQAFFRLQKWLRARGITLKTRLQLWRSCIYSTLVYGLLASNLTHPGLTQLSTFIMGTLRQVVGNFSFLTKMTHRQFLRHYDLPHPFAQLLSSVAQLRYTHRQRLMHILSHDILHRVDWTNLNCVETLIQTAWQAQELMTEQTMPSHVDEVPKTYFPCSWCSLQFDSLPNLRRHQTHVHGCPQLRTFQVTVASHAKNGLPICTTCHKTFSTWRRFTIHLERNCCQAMTKAASSTWRPVRAPDDTGLTPQDLSLLMSKPYGPQLIQAVAQSRWTLLRAMPQAHADLRSYCILCGVYHGRPQELNMHVRTHHGRLAANVFAKAAQLGRSQASISPCFFCEKTFLRQHQCPFWTQIALLLVNLPSTGHDACPDVVLRCEVCLQQFDNLQAIHSHLFSDHKLEIHDFLPNRDLLGADPVCSHCLACFADRSAVRQHITRGQCPAFHAAKPIDEMPVAQQWQNIIIHGNLNQLMESPMQRLSLTLHCQLCGVRFERQQDLVHHLQMDHADRWTAAQIMTQLIMQVGHMETPCVCNPQTTSRGLSHVCPAYRQISMLALRVEHDLFLPWTFDRDQTHRFLAGIQNHAVVEMSTQTLEERRFTDLWLQPNICHLLSNVCLICGGSFHPAVLSEHIKAMHCSSCQWIPAIMPQLLSAFLKTTICDYQCKSCDLIFNLPTTDVPTPEQQIQRDHLVQIHAQHHCPVVYQTGLLLTNGLPSTNRRSADGRCGNLGGLQGDGTPPPERQICQRSGDRKRAKKAQKKPCPGEHNTGSGGDTIGEAHGQHATATGCRTPADEKARLLRLLSANRRTGAAASTAAEGQGMACSDEATCATTRRSTTICPSPHSAFPGPGNATGGQSAEAFQGQLPGSSVGDSHNTWSPDFGREFPVPAMVSTAEVARVDEEGSYPHEPHAEVHGTTEADFSGPGRHPEVSCVETGGDQYHGTVDPSNRNAARRDPTVAGNPIRVHSVGPHWSHHEGTHAGGQSTESRTSATVGEGKGQAEQQPIETQRQRQAPEPMNADAHRRHSLRARFEEMQLINMENWCYANTALVTLLWALLSCQDISLDDWGTLSRHIVHFIQHATNPIHLPDVSWFQTLLQTWNGDGAQCDPVEFLTHLVTGLDIPGLNWTWERRVQMGAEISIRDAGDKMTPITLYVDPELSHAGWIRLDSLIHSWHNYMGMQTALTQDTPLLCFHIDRNVLTGDGQTAKSDLSIGMHGVFGVPCYTDHTLDITWHDYKVIAAIAHLGTDQAGHCRAILRVQADQRNEACPYMHLLTDDNVTPSRCWHEPTWFLQNIMCIWLCKMSALDLHTCDTITEPSAAQTTDPTTAQLMHLLCKLG